MEALIVITLVMGAFALIAMIDDLLDKHERKVRKFDE